jgi:hypothetical protein
MEGRGTPLAMSIDVVLVDGVPLPVSDTLCQEADVGCIAKSLGWWSRCWLSVVEWWPLSSSQGPGGRMYPGGLVSYARDKERGSTRELGDLFKMQWRAQLRRNGPTVEFRYAKMIRRDDTVSDVRIKLLSPSMFSNTKPSDLCLMR